MNGQDVTLSPLGRTIMPKKPSILSTWWPLTLSATMAEADALDDMAKNLVSPDAACSIQPLLWFQVRVEAWNGE